MKQRHNIRTILDYTAVQQRTLNNHFGGLFQQYLFAKQKRVAEAIYLLTNHLKDTDGLKESVRKMVVECVSMSVRLKGGDSEQNSNVLLDKIATNLIGVASLLEIATVSEMISPANYFIIARELDQLLTTLQERLKDKKIISSQLSPSFFDVDIKDNTAQMDSVKDSIKDKDMSYSEELVRTAQGFGKPTAANQSEPIKSPQGQSRSLGMSVTNPAIGVIRTDERERREKSVMSFFGDGKKLTVNDVQRFLPHYSEKTVQRELIRLVSIGLLYREGKKRWTRYFRIS